MIQHILEKVKNKTLIVKDTSSDDCDFLEPTTDNESSFIICKSYVEDETEDYLWKIIKLDEWGMFNESSETYFKKGKVEFDVIEKIHTEIYK